jgi:hypothetical protein
VLTISRLSRWSINYYNGTANQAKQAAMDRQRANGGLGEYYLEADTRVPTWLVVGNAVAVGERTGLDGAALAGGVANTETAARWLDDGIAPNGASGRAFTTGSVHGFDLTFAAPKTVSLVRALTNDLGEKIAQAAALVGSPRTAEVLVRRRADGRPPDLVRSVGEADTVWPTLAPRHGRSASRIRSRRRQART